MTHDEAVKTVESCDGYVGEDARVSGQIMLNGAFTKEQLLAIAGSCFTVPDEMEAA